ncbi:MAG: DUF2933 domain-containing protein [Roseateles sp.]|uniref:DUF2933 domain-containing protein n=1 Tax=Roseateles sp. TaxID=1971397 RepID=UPI004036AC20
MSTNHVHPSQPESSGLSLRAVWGAVVMVALIGLVFLLREHWSHLAGSWIYLVLLACPLMHLFHGHGGHGGHGGHRDIGSSPSETKVS